MQNKTNLLLSLCIILAAAAGVTGCGKSGPTNASSEDKYGQSLDQALDKQKAISDKARNLAQQRQELEKQVEKRNGGGKAAELKPSPAAPQLTEEAFFQAAASGKWDMDAIAAAANASTSGNTPLHLAVAIGDSAIVEALCKRGADVNAKNRDGDTPLIFAAKQKFHERSTQPEQRLGQIIETALMTLVGKHGAAIDAKNNAGQTAADVATGKFAEVLRTPDLQTKIRDAASTMEAAKSEKCENNLKNVGLAFRIFATDNGDRFPFNVSAKDGGSMEFRKMGPQGYDANAFRHFQVMSNELSTPRILICPADATKHEATNWAELSDQRVSYDIRSNSELNESKPNEVLVRCAIHGHVVMCDGSVRATPRVTPTATAPIRRDSSSPQEQAKLCMQNLRMIEGAKEQWALENKKTEGAPTAGAERAINAFLRGAEAPVCPAGGTYTYGKVGQEPRCTLEASGHSLTAVPQNKVSAQAAPGLAAGSDPLAVTMKDATTLTGTFATPRVKFRTTYGNVDVNTDEIVSLQDGFLKLNDGSSLKGTFGDGNIPFKTTRGVLDLPAAEITRIARQGDKQEERARPNQTASPTPAVASESGSVLAGRVLDNFGKPLAGATVRIANSRFAAQTDPQGTYSVAYVPGKVQVLFQKTGYHGNALTLDIAVASRYPVQDVFLFQNPPGEGLFVVREADYLPIAKCDVRFAERELRGGGLSGATMMWTYSVVGAPTSAGSPGNLTFLDTPGSQMNLYKVSGNNEFYRKTMKGIGLDFEHEYQLVQHTTKTVQGLLLRSVRLDPGLYVFASGNREQSYNIGGDHPVHGPGYFFSVPARNAAEVSKTEQAIVDFLKDAFARAVKAPEQPDKTFSDPKREVNISYPAEFEVHPNNRPVVAFFWAPSDGKSDQERVKISVTCGPTPLLNRNPSLEKVLNETINGTRSSLEGATFSEPFKTKLAGLEAQTFVATGLEGGVLKQKAVTVAVGQKRVLGVVLHATPDTFPKYWDAFRRVCDSYQLSVK